MIWPADVSAWLVDLAGATGQVEGMMILAGMALWYAVALGAFLGLGVAGLAVANKLGGGV